MARTSKTKIGEGEGEQGERMMRANASGHAMQTQARQDLIAQRERGMDRPVQQGAQAAGLINEFEARQQQQGQFDARMGEERRQFDARFGQEQDRLELDAARSGFERGQGPGGDRAAQLEQEMDRGAAQTGPPGGIGPLQTEEQERLRRQGQQPLEMEGGRWRPTEERRRQMKREDFNADTERIRAEAYRDQVGQQVQQARIKGNAEDAKELAQTLSKPINGDVQKFDRLMKGEVQERDWSDLADYAKGSEEVDPTLMNDIKAKQFTPRVQQFLRSHISRESIKYIIRTGDTSNLKVDWTAPQMQQFVSQVANFNSIAKSMGPEFAQYAKINSIEDKMAFLNTQAALAVYMGMSAAPRGQLPMPSAGGPAGGGGAPSPMVGGEMTDAEQASPSYHPSATDEATRRAIAARKAGKYVPPTDTDEFRHRFGNESWKGGARYK